MGWLITFRVLLSVSANAVQKRLLLDRAGIYQTWILTYSLMLGPALLLAAPDIAKSTPTFWREIALGGALDALGNLAMVAALRVTDISVFGPLNALRPILALLFGWVWLGESPSAMGMLGVAVTVLGGVLLFSDSSQSSRAPIREVVRAVTLRVAGLSLGVIGAVFLKRAALVSSAEMTVAGWLACGLMVLFGSALVHRRSEMQQLRETAKTHYRWLLVHGAVFFSMQLLTIRIFQGTLLAYSFVYFQLGMVLQVFIGRIFFQERAFVRRLLASMVMAAGSVLVLWRG